jgi:thiamine-monophosphate kinase
VPPGHDLLLTTDLLTEGIHFDTATASWRDIGYKAAVSNFSDIAAMGGRARHVVVSIALPPDMDQDAVFALYAGLAEACRRAGAVLVGGDTSASRGGLFISLAVTGVVRSGRALRRDGARAGNDLYVTGTLGDAAAGLALLRRSVFVRPAHRHILIGRHLRPSARLDIGQRLVRNRLATAAIDLSDGLSGDVRHVCRASGVGVEIELDALPVSAATRAYAAAAGLRPAELALAGGEDYELLFTARPRHRMALERLAGRGLKITRIGVIRPRAFGLKLRDGGALRPLPLISYEHFRSGRAGQPRGRR